MRCVEERRIFTSGFGQGALYDLAIELGPLSDERLLAAATALWQHESLDGPYADPLREPWEQELVSPSLILTERAEKPAVHVFGVATLPDGTEIAAGSLAVREGRYRGPGRPRREDKPDWLVFYIPLTALELIYGFETVEDWNWPEWKALDNWLAQIGRSIYEVVPFALGLIGEEASGQSSAQKVQAAGPEKVPYSVLLPDERGELAWYPLPHE